MEIYRLGRAFQDLVNSHYLVVTKAPATLESEIELVDLITDAQLTFPMEWFHKHSRFPSVPKDALIPLADGCYYVTDSDNLVEDVRTTLETFGPKEAPVLHTGNVVYPEQFIKARQRKLASARPQAVVGHGPMDYHPIELLKEVRERLNEVALNHPEISLELGAISTKLRVFSDDLELQLAQSSI